MDNIPYLCGGTFFVLILHARKQRNKARDRYHGGSDGLTEMNVLTELIRVAQPQYAQPSASTFKQNTSAYKACQVSHGTYLPFNEQAFKDVFDKQIKTDYSKAIAAMSDFADQFLDLENTVKIKRLVKALLDVIETDGSIAETDRFYLGDKNAVTKAAIRKMTEICLQPFLLAVWHFVVMNRQDNTIGRTTFEQWHKAPEVSCRPWSFISNIGNGIERSLHITRLESIAEDSDRKGNTEKNNGYVRNPCSTDPQGSSMCDRTIRITSTDHINPEVNSVTPGSDNASVHAENTCITLSDEFFNLFVIQKERFIGKGFLVPRNRVLKSYMMPEVMERFTSLSEDAISQITTFPSLFMDEYHDFPKHEEEQMAYFGVVTDLSGHENGLYIRFRRSSSVPLKRIFDLSFKLGLYGDTSFHELHHTHWAIKKVDLVDVLKGAGINVLIPT